MRRTRKPRETEIKTDRKNHEKINKKTSGNTCSGDTKAHNSGTKKQQQVSTESYVT
jgi:hypothetical protein